MKAQWRIGYMVDSVKVIRACMPDRVQRGDADAEFGIVWAFSDSFRDETVAEDHGSAKSQLTAVHQQ